MFDYVCDFNLDKCIRTMGLEERGRVQQVVTDEVLRLSDEYVPFSGRTLESLKASGHTENDTDIVWNAPYAHYMWNGIVYVDPDLHCAGFKTENGWRSRKDIKKVPSDPVRKLQYHNGSNRSDHWVERMMQDGGRELIEQAARTEAGK